MISLNKSNDFGDNNQYYLIIIGGGIAGLTIGEIFARSGFSVAIVEKNPFLCSQASGKQHGWFHMGSLYSIMGDATYLKTTITNCENLIAYYRDFQRMNLQIEPKRGRITTNNPAQKQTWFNDEESRLVYLLEKAVTPGEDRHFRESHGIDWHDATKLFTARHNRFCKCDWRRGIASGYISQADFNDYPLPSEINRLKLPNLETQIPIANGNYNPILGMDRSMNVDFIIEDLTKSFLFYGGTILSNHELIRYEKVNGVIQVFVKDQENKIVQLKAEKMVKAMARDFYPGFIKDGYFINVKTVASPLLLISPAISKRNFQILSPISRRGLNHIIHSRDDKSYSLIGDHSSANPKSEAEIKDVQESLMIKALYLFPDIHLRKKDTYICYKTELVRSIDTTGRNYSYIIEEIDRNILAVLPGKLSLSFSLAIDTFTTLQGHTPCPVVNQNYKNQITDCYVSALFHQKLMDQLYMGKQVVFHQEAA